MKFTDLFIKRPILTLVVSSLIVMLGVLALMKLPIRQYPALESATLTVSTTYPGARSSLMQEFVTQPVAQAVASVDGIDYITSSSTQGKSVVNIRLKLNADSNKAMTEIMAAVSQVKYRLPQGAYDPVVEKSSGEGTAVVYIGFSSESMPISGITDYVSRTIQPLFSSIEGVAKAELLGNQTLAMRVWLDPKKMAARNISANDVADALRKNNYQSAPGQTKGTYVAANIYVNTDLTTIEQFREMVVKRDGDTLIRLEDIGTVEFGSASYEVSGIMNGEPAVFIGLHATPTGNPLTIVNAVKNMMPAVQKNLPAGVKVSIPFEVARFISASIDEVMHTLAEAVVIVTIVIYLFLGSSRSVLIPLVTIPMSLVGAAAFMSMLGFSLNLLTLLAMVLAIGLVVDDAIVVVENVHRHIEDGKPPLQAAIIGAREISGPVIAMSITLAAVYAPIGLMGGLTGALFKEFAFTLAGAVVVSGIVALTLSPVMCSFLLNDRVKDTWMARHAEYYFQKLGGYYGGLLRISLQRRWISLSIAFVMLLSLPFLYMGAQRELAPVEDQSQVLAVTKAPQYANIDYTEAYSRKLDRLFASFPETENTWVVNGTDGPQVAFGGANLRNWSQRSRSANDLQQEIQNKAHDIEGVGTFAFQLPSLPGSTGGLPIQMVIQSSQDYHSVYLAMEKIKKAARESGLFSVVDSDLDFNSPLINIRINRSKANDLGISMQEIGESLAVLVGENYVNRFALDGRSYDVIPQLPRSERMSGDVLVGQYVRATNGQPIPLSTLVSFDTKVEANKLTQFNQLNSATLQAVPARGVSVGDAVKFLSAQADLLPNGFTHDWLSDARQYIQEGNALMMTFAFALVVIYMVLAAQFESLRDPLVILISVPMSICGALIPLFLGYASLNIYTQIGLVTLIGLISKHGILMVEFANELQVANELNRSSAIEQAAVIRMRPILMTTAAMVVGLVPLLFASGAGANSRFSLGLVIVVGMLIGTLFTLFVLPTVYTLLAKDHRFVHQSEREQCLASVQETVNG
ncbi:RND multidrug efflux transporter [Paraburkholderia caribensis MBA4]|uniref:RND multidrug efflux transporter n=1 Tax=Paraburkholderia caribensis MBA4 TaxID=1323664 RepID=A0A0P0RGF3_9BURK|nr:MexW/MexI family multidrug efflux RND transporter permease subunit [Paraburkholderia caribensis]ALL67616.1 RND multidrug efflux transporter [Paraburkholderia caribensis MBA4]